MSFANRVRVDMTADRAAVLGHLRVAAFSRTSRQIAVLIRMPLYRVRRSLRMLKSMGLAQRKPMWVSRHGYGWKWSIKS